VPGSHPKAQGVAVSAGTHAPPGGTQATVVVTRSALRQKAATGAQAFGVPGTQAPAPQRSLIVQPSLSSQGVVPELGVYVQVPPLQAPIGP
jgi:hypothetical protein